MTNEIEESPWQRARRRLFGTPTRKLVSIVIVMSSIAGFHKYGWRLFNVDITTASWGIIVAAAGGGILSWVTAESSERIRNIGLNQVEIQENSRTSMNVFAAFLMVATVFYGAIFTVLAFIQFISAFHTQDYFEKILFVVYRLFVLVLVIMYPAIVGLYLCRGWGWLDRIFKIAAEDPEEFKRSATLAGYRLLFLGTLMQFFGGLSLK